MEHTPTMVLAHERAGLVAIARGHGTSPVRRAVWHTAFRRSIHSPSAPPWYHQRGRPALIRLALIGLLLLCLLLLQIGTLGGGRAAPDAEFVIRIAPFTVRGQSDRTGQIVAEQLRDELAQRMTVPADLEVLRADVTSEEMAEAAARRDNAEVVIWGETLPGSTANAPGLRPRLLWLPNDPWEPLTWQGYDGHLALPRHFDLAAAPLNGAAVLPSLLDSLAFLSRGDADQAFMTLTALQRDYEDHLRPELPPAIRAVVLWAEGRLDESIPEAEHALAAAPRAEHWNNLGALLLDQHQHQRAREALLQALALDPMLVAAHVNLARLAMNEERPKEALPDLRTAAHVEQRPVMFATLAEALRRSGYLGQAREVFIEVLTREPDHGPALVESALLALTPAVTTTGRLEWELEEQPHHSAEQLAMIRTEAERGIALIDQQRRAYLRRATAFGAANRPAMQRLMETQARRLEEELLHRDYQLAITMIEQGRLHQRQPRSTLGRLWDMLRGKRTPLQEATILLRAVIEKDPGTSLRYDLQYQLGRAAYLAADPATARQAWDVAQAMAVPPEASLPARPEVWYGIARLAFDRGEMAEASANLQRALDADERFFPARHLIAKIAINEQRWADAEPQLRWLAEHQPSSHATIGLATVLREQGRLQEAEAVLLPLANNDDIPSLVQLARMYREAGQLAAADGVLQRALATDPRSAEVLEEQALLELTRPMPDYARGEDLLRQAIAADAGRASAYIELGKLLGNILDRPDAAARAFQAAIEHGNDDPLTYRELGETLLASGAPEAAADSFQRALRRSPTSHEAQHGLAMAYLALGRLDTAEQAEQKALDMAGGNYTLALAGLGDIARAREAYDQAIEHYTLALERDPEVAGVYLGLGQIAEARGNLAIARDHYRRGLEANPNNLLLLLALGQAQLAGADAAAALQTFEQAKRVAPAAGAPYTGTARALLALGRPDDALNELAAAIHRGPNDADVLLAVGDVQASRGETEQALQAYAQAAAARTDWYEPHLRRGVLLLADEQQPQAIDALESAVRLNERSAQSRYWLGRAYRSSGDYTRAIDQFQHAIEILPTYYEARFFLGRALDEQGNRADAIATYAALIIDAPSDDPWRQEAERELARIQ